MEAIHLKSRVGNDGVLKLEIPLGVTDTDIEVMVVVEPARAEPATVGGDLGWPSDFLGKIAGGWRGERLTRPDQGRLEVRDALK